MEKRVISFDIDGTLVHPEYNDLIWHKAMPELVALKKNISFDESVILVQREYDRIGDKDYRWYDISFWIEYFQLNIDCDELLHLYEDRIIIFPDVFPVLEQLSNKYRLICLSSMPREFLEIKIKNIKKYFEETFSTLSDYKKLKNIDVFKHISNQLSISPEKMLHIGDDEHKDYLAAQGAGWKSLLIDRSYSELHKKYPDSVISSLPEILEKIKVIF